MNLLLFLEICHNRNPLICVSLVPFFHLCVLFFPDLTCHFKLLILNVTELL